MKKSDYQQPNVRVIVLRHDRSLCIDPSSIRGYVGEQIEEGNDPF